MPEESKPNPSKRSRDEYQNGQDVEDPLAKAMEADTDDDDDDLGPMPMPAAEERQKATKKRKGELSLSICSRTALLSWVALVSDRIPVLPYAKLYLDDLPSANRYYKSFMHRDTISYIHVTKSVSCPRLGGSSNEGWTDDDAISGPTLSSAHQWMGMSSSGRNVRMV